MTRFTFALGIWVLAATCGILGYQSLTYYFYGTWPPVSVGFVWQTLLGDGLRSGSDGANRFFVWIGGLPLMIPGIALSYALFLLSDVFGGRARRRPQ